MNCQQLSHIFGHNVSVQANRSTATVANLFRLHHVDRHKSRMEWSRKTVESKKRWWWRHGELHQAHDANGWYRSCTSHTRTRSEHWGGRRDNSVRWRCRVLQHCDDASNWRHRQTTMRTIAVHKLFPNQLSKSAAAGDAAVTIDSTLHRGWQIGSGGYRGGGLGIFWACKKGVRSSMWIVYWQTILLMQIFLYKTDTSKLNIHSMYIHFVVFQNMRTVQNIEIKQWVMAKKPSISTSVTKHITFFTNIWSSKHHCWKLQYET